MEDKYGEVEPVWPPHDVTAMFLTFKLTKGYDRTNLQASIMEANKMFNGILCELVEGAKMTVTVTAGVETPGGEQLTTAKLPETLAKLPGNLSGELLKNAIRNEKYAYIGRAVAPRLHQVAKIVDYLKFDCKMSGIVLQKGTSSSFCTMSARLCNVLLANDHLASAAPGPEDLHFVNGAKEWIGLPAFQGEEELISAVIEAVGKIIDANPFPLDGKRNEIRQARMIWAICDEVHRRWAPELTMGDELVMPLDRSYAPGNCDLHFEDAEGRVVGIVEYKALDKFRTAMDISDYKRHLKHAYVGNPKHNSLERKNGRSLLSKDERIRKHDGLELQHLLQCLLQLNAFQHASYGVLTNFEEWVFFVRTPGPYARQDQPSAATALPPFPMP